MPNKILLKRDNTAGKKPLTTDLDYGEMGYNSYDGRLYARRNGVAGDEIVLIGDPEGKIIDAFSGSITAQTGSTTIPFDDTIPLNTEGTLMGAATLTTKNLSDHVSIDFSLSIESSQPNRTIIMAIFRDSTCIGAIPIAMPSNNQPYPFSWRLEDDPNIIGDVTYSGRIGITTGTWRINTPTGGTLGGMVETASSFIIIASTNGDI